MPPKKTKFSATAASQNFDAAAYDDAFSHLDRAASEFRADGMHDLTFQVIDCKQSEIANVTGISRVAHPVVPELRIYGATRSGNSVLLRVLNFEPYFWIEAPARWDVRFEEAFRQALNEKLVRMSKMPANAVCRVETHHRRSLMFHNADPNNNERAFIKIVVQVPGHVPRVREAVMTGVDIRVLADHPIAFSSYESNVIFPLRFLVDTGIGGCNWLTVAGPSLRATQNNRISTCQIELFCADPTAITNHEPIGEYLSIAPFRVLSFDIECLGRKGQFPEPEHDAVIQIANHCILYGNPDPLCKVIFTLKSCSPVAGADVRCFETEEELLLAWSVFLNHVDADFFTGYNICNFDMPYLLRRAAALNISGRFAHWSRIMNQTTTAETKTFHSKQMGNREYVEVNVDGRINLDVLVIMQRDHKLRSYSLNSVSQHFLGEQKEDVHHSIIADLQNGTEETRHRLAVYCLKDALLPLRLIEKLMIIVNNVEMARVTGVPIPWLLERGQQIKVFSQILRHARKKQLVFPTVQGGGAQPGAIGYEGATVISPMKGFYDRPIATLDFASLYPSIMMAHNLCYSTLVRKADVAKMNPDDVTRTPSNDYFVKPHVYSGILPEILRDLLGARKAAKKAMNEATDPYQKAVLNGRQLALKISANSVYGFTGAQVGKLPCLEISSSVTSFGRSMIEQTKRLVEEKYPGAIVVYGDTDSVMVQTVLEEDDEKEQEQEEEGANQNQQQKKKKVVKDDRTKLVEAMKFGIDAAEAVSQTFQKPIKLEFEKVYFPFLLMNKKRYAGLLWTNPDKYDKLDTKGIETVRRDNCQLVASVLSGVLNRILIQKSVQSAIDYVKGTISDLLMNRLDISQLVVSKSYSKSADKYDNKQAHIVLVEKMRKRDPASAPTVGDRVAYVIVKGATGARAFEKSEDPIYVLENNVPIDVNYYLEHYLKGPLSRVFEAVMDDPSELVKGDHTRHVAVALPSSAAGGMMKFIQVRKTCLSCKSAVKGNDALCNNCQEKAPDVYTACVSRRNHYESIYSKVWTQCQQCQGSLHQEVLCTAKDCPVFYMRKKVEKDLKDSQDTLDRFGIPVPDW